MKKIVIIGDGGHGKVIQSIVHEQKDMKLVAIIDKKFKNAKKEEGVIYAPFSFVSYFIEEGCKICIGIGKNEVRKKIVNSLELSNHDFVTIIDPSAILKKDVTIGQGTVIMPKTVINSGTVVGEHVIINTGAIIEHDNKIEDFVHISPGAVLAGGVTIKVGAQVAVSASVIPLKKIGGWSIIGAGSTVIEDIPSHSTAVGSPAKVIKKDKGD